MPERIVGMITGDLPTPLMPIPWATWETYEIRAGRDKIIAEITQILDSSGNIIVNVEEIVECKTETYQNRMGGWTAAIEIPKKISQEYGIRLSHYLDVKLLKIKRDDENIVIFPKRQVFELYPFYLKDKLCHV